MRRTIAILVVGLSVTFGGLIVAPLPGEATTPPLPTRMVAVGDSITTATDVDWCCVNPSGGNPQYSWSTGTESSVNSHYLRISAASGGAPVATLNVAQPGADSGDLQNQLGKAAAFEPEYVTMLMGANDLCWNPTPTGIFRQRVKAALAGFFASAPNAHLFVSSIPNLYRLWSIEHNNPIARFVWGVFDICPTMLGSNVTESQRQKILTLEQSFNSILATACAEHANCRWDGNATFNFAFTTTDISPVDYFHPSTTGQHDLAAVTWAASFWG
jgi:GDSL-like Lipase/Acylhydrolase